ncbi:MAG: MFS transporter [Candidatus Angelobacter sp. Gp1-AA117]|nr:MAG: MFS transporter [Candidatus Angelobacter sp. Gp1-AA117]
MNDTRPPEKPRSSRKLPAALRSLRHRNYQLFFGGQLISLVGTWMDQVAESWLVYRLTGSALLLGTVAFASQIPVFLLAPIGGIVADRYNRRTILVITQSSMMVITFVLAGITLAHVVQVWHVVLLAALTGIVNAFDIPARQAFIVDMVSREDLLNAIALNSSMFNGARVVGPALAGIVVAAVGEGWCFFANGVSFLAVIAGLLMMQLVIPRRSLEGSPLENIIEGFRFVAGTGPIRALMLLLGMISFTGMPYAVLMPVFADQILHGGAQGLGLLMGASGLGALSAAITLANKKTVTGLGQWVAVAASCFGVSLILFSISRHFWLSVALLIPVGFFIMLQMASSNTLIQSMVPDHLRGRVMAVYSMMFMGMAPLGALLAGSLAHGIGAPMTVAMGGVIALISGTVFGSRLSALRPVARQLIVAQQMSGGTPAQEITARVFSKRGEEAS